MQSPNEQFKSFEKWYKRQWIKVSIKYALSDLFNLVKTYLCKST